MQPQNVFAKRVSIPENPPVVDLDRDNTKILASIAERVTSQYWPSQAKLSTIIGGIVISLNQAITKGLIASPHEYTMKSQLPIIVFASASCINVLGRVCERISRHRCLDYPLWVLNPELILHAAVIAHSKVLRDNPNSSKATACLFHHLAVHSRSVTLESVLGSS